MEAWREAIQPSGVTVVTHGFQPDNAGGDALKTLASGIWDRAEGLGNAYLVDYDLASDNFEITEPAALPVDGVLTQAEVIFLHDWADGSNEFTGGWGEAAGDALASMLLELGLTGVGAPLHFIGHSFGTAVTSEAVERLGSLGVQVDQVTYLDPHDFNQTLVFDTAQELDTLGRPAGYGASVWSNVAFSDTYYQTSSRSLLPADTIPDGRPIPGSYNRLLSEIDLGGGFAGADSDHSRVWADWYLGSVADPAAYRGEGYGFSRLLGGEDTRPEPVFYGSGQDHEHSLSLLVDTATGQPNTLGLARAGLSGPAEVVQGRWRPEVSPFHLSNGDFEAGVSPTAAGRIAGWSGYNPDATTGAPGRVQTPAFGSTHFLRLDSSGPARTHSLFHVPEAAERVYFDAQRVLPGSGEFLRVTLSDEELTAEPIRLEGVDPGYRSYAVTIPQNLRGDEHTLTFALSGGPGSAAEVNIDNVTLGRADASPVARLGTELGREEFWAWTDRLLDETALTGALPLIGQARQFLDGGTGQAVQQRLAALFTRPGFDALFNMEQFRAALAEVDGVEGVVVTVDTPSHVEAELDVRLSWVERIQIDGSTLGETPLELTGGSVDVRVDLDLDLRVGAEDGNTAGLAVYLSTTGENEIRLGLSIETGEEPLEVQLGTELLGSLDVTPSLDARIAIDLVSDDPRGPGYDGRLYLLELEELARDAGDERPGLADAFEARLSGTAGLKVDLTDAELPSRSEPVAANNGLELVWRDLNRPADVAVTYDGDERGIFEAIGNLSSDALRAGVEAGLERFIDTIASVETLEVLAGAVPLLGSNLGDLTRLSEELRSALGDVIDPAEPVSLAGVRDALEDKLRDAFNDSVSVALTLEDSLLRYELSLSQENSAGNDLQLLALDVAQLTAGAAAPASGRLGVDVAFDLSVDGGQRVRVEIAADASNASRADLVEDLEVALLTAGLGGVVSAELSAEGDKLILRGINRQAGGLRSLSVHDAGDGSLMRLGFQTGDSATNQGLAQDLLLEEDEDAGVALSGSLRAFATLNATVGLDLDRLDDPVAAFFLEFGAGANAPALTVGVVSGDSPTGAGEWVSIDGLEARLGPVTASLGGGDPSQNQGIKLNARYGLSVQPGVAAGLPAGATPARFASTPRPCPAGASARSSSWRRSIPSRSTSRSNCR